MDTIMEELPQLIISILFIVLIGALLITRVISTSDPIFIGGSGSILAIIAAYWLGNGLVRLSHTQTMKAVAQQAQLRSPAVSHETQPMLSAVHPSDSQSQA